MGQPGNTLRALHVTCSPIWPTNSGYKQSVQGRIWEAVSAGTRVTVLALNNQSDELSYQGTQPPELVNVDYQVVTSTSVRNPLLELINLFTEAPRIARIFSTSQFVERVSQAIAKTNPATIVAESIWAVCAIERSEWHRVNIIIHDITELMLRASMEGERSLLRKLFHWRDLQRCQSFERSILTDFPGQLTFLTQEDQAYYTTRFKIAPTRSSLAANRLMVKKLERNVQVEPPFLLFPGSVEFHQNFTALEWMAKEVWPVIRAMRGKPLDLEIVVTGRASGKSRSCLSALGMPIRWLGEVPYSELDKLYASCLCVVSPIRTGTGIKIKNLETVGKEVPLIATKLSARGINSQYCHRASDDSASAFSEALLACIEREWIMTEKAR